MPFGRSAVAVLARAADPGRASCGDLPPTELQSPNSPSPVLNNMLSADALQVPLLATERTPTVFRCSEFRVLQSFPISACLQRPFLSFFLSFFQTEYPELKRLFRCTGDSDFRARGELKLLSVWQMFRPKDQVAKAEQVN